MLVSGSSDTTALLWNVTGLPGRKHKQFTPLSAKEVETLWATLADSNAAKAHQAICQLTTAPPQTVPFLQGHLQPVASADGQRISRWIAALDSNRFAVRDQAAKELDRLGELAEPALRQALERQGLSLEMRRRLEQLLAQLHGPVTEPERLRALRAIEVLEHIGTAEAKQMLANLAKGAPQARVTQEAKVALERLAKRSTTIR
jgi:hypothetical protein